MESKTEEVFYAGYISRCIFYFTIIFISVIIMLWLFGLFPKIFLIIPVIYDWFDMWGMFVVFLVVIFILFGISTNISEKLIVSPSGIEYSNMLTKIFFAWEDIQNIEIVSFISISEKGEVIPTWKEYIIRTSKGNFSINKHNIWDSATLKRMYEVVTSYIPNKPIIEKEQVTIVKETYYPETP